MAEFNPEDFVFEKLPLPEDNPTILEYDSKSRICLIRTTDPSTKKEYYEYCVINETLNENILSNFPEEWSNRNDKIVQFWIRKDGSYGLEKEKLKFNFKTKESQWIRYRHNNLTLENAKEIFEVIKAAVWVQHIKNENDQETEMLELAKKSAYLDQMYLKRLSVAQNWLRESDWRIIEDSPQSFDGERDLWVKWREYLRTCVKPPTDFEDEIEYLLYLEEFTWPINPETYHNLYPDHDVEYLSTEDQFSKSDVSITEDKMKKINATINEYVARYQHKQENGGIPVEKNLYDVIEKYSLTKNLDNIVLIEENK